MLGTYYFHSINKKRSSKSSSASSSSSSASSPSSGMDKMEVVVEKSGGK